MHSIDHRLSPIQNTRVHSAARRASSVKHAVDLTRILSHVSKLTYACAFCKHNLLPNAERATFLVLPNRQYANIDIDH